MPEANQYITHIKQLKHILPSEAVPMLTPMAKNAAGIVALDVSKTLVLRDNSSNIKRMLELLERIDIKPEEDYKLKVIPIRYGKVEEIYATMQDLITGSSSPRQSPSGTSRTSGRTSSSQGSTGRASSSRGSVRSLQNRPSTSSSTSNSFRNRLQGIVNRAAGGDIQILENARIIPDYRSNSLIVFANEEDMVKIDEIVGHVDNLLAQVLIEAIIVNVTLTDGMNTGMNAFMHSGGRPRRHPPYRRLYERRPFDSRGCSPPHPPTPGVGIREAKGMLPMLVMSSPLPGVHSTHSAPVPWQVGFPISAAMTIHSSLP